MSEVKAASQKDPGLEVETRVAASPTTSITMGEPDVADPRPRSDDGAAVVSETDGARKTVRTGLDERDLDDEISDEIDDEIAGDDEEEDGEKTSKDDGNPDPLPAFDDKDEAVVKRYDERYFTGGSFNKDALGAEFWANNAAKKPGLNEDTYKYLEVKRGIPRDMVKDIEAALVARSDAQTQQIYARAGGEEVFNQAIEWARKGGYTQGQRKRFNDALASGDLDVTADAVDLLMTRYKAGEPDAAEPRSVKGKRTATGGSAAPSEGGGYADRDEWLKARKEAEASKDQRKIAEVRAKMRKSAWARQSA